MMDPGLRELVGVPASGDRHIRWIDAAVIKEPGPRA